MSYKRIAICVGLLNSIGSDNCSTLDLPSLPVLPICLIFADEDNFHSSIYGLSLSNSASISFWTSSDLLWNSLEIFLPYSKSTSIPLSSIPTITGIIGISISLKTE